MALICLLALPACAQQDPPPTRARIQPASKACKGISWKGCCLGNTLTRCVSGLLVTTACASPKQCGWEASAARYLCTSSNKSDPAGIYPRSCMAYSGDSGPPTPDGPAPDGPVPDALLGCGDNLCKGPVEDCNTCPADCGKCTGCEIRKSPRCLGCACEACVCKADPDCCKKSWDALCVGRCKATCGGCTGQGDAGAPDATSQCGNGLCASPVEDCSTCPADCGSCTGCEVRSTPKCPGCKCEACVCQADPDCCNKSWDALCVSRCQAKCGGCGSAGDGGLPDLPKAVCGNNNCDLPAEDCQTCPADCGKCTGCQARGTPKCKGCACEACVCQADPDCCSKSWDALCVSRCKTLCGGCKVSPDSGAPDLPAPDLITPDQALPDLPAPDLSLPDLSLPDLSLPDLPAPDLAQPDLVAPDSKQPDQPLPDQPRQDHPWPDRSFPDLLASDQPPPSDQTAHDRQARDIPILEPQPPDPDQGCSCALSPSAEPTLLWALLAVLLASRRRGRPRD